MPGWRRAGPTRTRPWSAGARRSTPASRPRAPRGAGTAPSPSAGRARCALGAPDRSQPHDLLQEAEHRGVRAERAPAVHEVGEERQLVLVRKALQEAVDRAWLHAFELAVADVLADAV